jgi:hypothetical protein
MSKDKVSGIWHRKMLFIIALWLISFISLYAQETSSNGKALNIPARKFGLSIGNSYHFTGIRINFADHDVKKINGINLSLWFRQFKNEGSVYNGINAGIFPIGGTMRPLSLGVVSLGCKDKAGGLSITGGMIGAGAINGISVSGIGAAVKESINGLSYATFILFSYKGMNGIVISPFTIQTKGIMKGLALSCGYFHPQELRGIAVAGYSKSEMSTGISVALYNRTSELHGLQIGLLNYAANNPKGLKTLPLFNLHLGKKIEKTY